MIGAASGSSEVEDTVAIAVRMYEAVTEQDVFAVLHAACEGALGSGGLDGYVMAPDGRTLRHVAGLGPLSGGLAFSDVARWLNDGVELSPKVAGPDDVAVVGHRLTAGPRVVGGLVVTGPALDEAASRRWAVVARLAAGAISGLQQRRLSHMVLEALEQSEEAVCFYDENEGVVFTNDAYHGIFPHYPDRLQLRGMPHLDLYRMDLEAGVIDDPLARSDPEAYLAERARKSQLLVERQREIQKIGSRTYIYTRTRSKTGATMSRRTDITDQTSTEARLRERETELHAMVFRDPLTGLFNRAHLREHLGQLQDRLSAGEITGVAVFLVDLNGFKVVNDTYGHECGDHVLKAVAERLTCDPPDGCAIVRLGGDEFVVVFARAIEEEELANLAERIIATLADPIAYGDLLLQVGVSIGIARVAGGPADIGSIISNADLAMYEAKKQKSSAYRFFQSSMREALFERLALVEDMRGALRRGEFELHYQPQITTRGERLVGFEALARWRHPKYGLVSPEVFIPLMEEHGLIEALGEWVLRTACAEARKWPSDLKIAVNVSPLQVRSARFSLTLCETLLETGLSPHRLELEITESVFLVDEKQTRAELENWKVLGVRIALDDFGRGYSSLSYLSVFPIDKIKIDRAFIRAFDAGQPDAAATVILPAIIDLGRTLGMTVIAEGVERQDQLEYLRRLACTEVQGFLLGRPMPAEQALRFVQAARVVPSSA